MGIKRSKIRTLWKGLGGKKQTFVRAFPEFKKAIIQLYHDGYSSYRIEQITGVSAGAVMWWVTDYRKDLILNEMKSNPHYLKIRDEIMKEMRLIQTKHRQKRMDGKYLGGFDPQEHDLDDEWELSDPI